MNPILEKWLAEQAAKKENKKNAYLIRLGLVDPEKNTKCLKDVAGRVLSEEEAEEVRRNNGTVYESGTSAPIEVTEEEYALICKYCPDIERSNEDELLSQIAKDVRFFKIVVIIGLVISVILGIIIGLS